MIMRALLILFVSSTLLSCVNLPPKTEENEGWYFEVGNALRSYNYNYYTPPENIDDLLHYIELDGSLLSYGYVEQSYDFLVKNRERIIILQLPLRELLEPEELTAWEKDHEERLNDIYTAIFFKNRKHKNLVGFIPFETSCNDGSASFHITFFDPNGDPIMQETRSNEYNQDLQKRLWMEVRNKFTDIKWQQQEGEYFKDFMVVEYSHEYGLRDVCNNSMVEVDGSAYFEAFSDCLQHFMQDHPELSRIILDTYIPVE